MLAFTVAAGPSALIAVQLPQDSKGAFKKIIIHCDTNGIRVSRAGLRLGLKS